MDGIRKEFQMRYNYNGGGANHSEQIRKEGGSGKLTVLCTLGRGCV